MKEGSNVHRGVTVLNFDNTYTLQPHLQQRGYEWIDLLDIKEAKGYCTMESLRVISERIKGRNHRHLTLIGSGNYHYVSLLLISEIRQPFTLILFDRHADMMPPPNEHLITCGSWVLIAMERLPSLSRTIIVGVDESQPRAPKSIASKVTVVPASPGSSQGLAHAIVETIRTEAVYISIDKDVLSGCDAVTDWGSGDLRLEQLISWVDAIAERRRVIGVDICGEYAYSPVAAFSRETVRAARRNARANRALIESARGWLSRHRPLAS